MILELETLQALKPGDIIRHWGHKRTIAKIGEVRQYPYTGLPWRMVELSNNIGGTTMFAIAAGDNGPACEEVVAQ